MNDNHSYVLHDLVHGGYKNKGWIQAWMVFKPDNFNVQYQCSDLRIELS